MVISSLAHAAKPGDQEAAAPDFPAALRDDRGERAPRGGGEPAERQPHRGGLGAHQAAQRAPQLPPERLPGEKMERRKAEGRSGVAGVVELNTIYSVGVEPGGYVYKVGRLLAEMSPPW